MEDLKQHQLILKEKIETLLEETNIEDEQDKKRTLNYLKWLAIKTDLVKKEKSFVIPSEKDVLLTRGHVVWVDFGFNLGREFGGRHPALILQRTGESVFITPLSSKKPQTVFDYHVEIPKVYGFKDMIRWTNVLKVQNISVLRIDYSSSIGNVKGPILDAINRALKNCNPLNL